MTPIVKEVVVDSTIEKAWEYITDSEKLEEWLMPNDFKLELDHKFKFECSGDDCDTDFIECRVLEIKPFQKIMFSWFTEKIGAETFVTLSLEKLDEGVKLTLVHSGWDKLGPDVKDTRDEFDGGWHHFVMERLVEVISS